MAAILLCGAMPVTAGEAPEWGVAILPSGTELGLEIAADPEKRRVGYMFRDRIGERQGMLFVFDASERHGMWMKNCRVDLDMIWLDEQLRIVHIAPDRKPCPEEGPCPPIVPMTVARYVLEVAAGTAKREELRIGQRIDVLAEPPLP